MAKGGGGGGGGDGRMVWGGMAWGVQKGRSAISALDAF
jgi:hypothetical protein